MVENSIDSNNPRSKSCSGNTILCLDLGTQMGYAVITSGGFILSGSVNLNTDRFSGGGMRFLKFKQWLQDINRVADPIDVIYFESVSRHLGTHAAHTYGGFWATLTAWCEQEKIPYEGVPVGKIKKFATGRGRANKQVMIDAAKKRGHDPVDDNEADAINLLYYALGQYQGGAANE